MKRIVSGIQSSGRLHLGNYLGSISNFVKLQDAYEMFVFVADLHAITVDFDPETIKQSRKDVIATYLASGLDPEKATIFIQSDVHEHAELGHVLLCQTAIGELERMTQYKNKIANELTRQENNTLKVPTGLLTYPALMSADILLYKPELIPVGADQKQHIELTRDLALRFNKRFGDTFVIPEPMIAKIGSRIMDLYDPSKKMSKSSKNTKGVIFLDDSIDTIIDKIKTAKTDSLNKVTFDVDNQPNISNMIAIYCCCINDGFNEELRNQMFNTKSQISIQDIENKYKDCDYRKFKADLTEVVVGLVKQLQDRKNKIISSGIIKNILEDGKRKAQAIASSTLREVYDKIGFQKVE